MSEEPSRGQSLDQILASIRNSLTGARDSAQAEAEAADDAADADAKAAEAAKAAKAEGTAAPAGDAAPDYLSAKLASALNGQANGAYAADEDFSDLLAHVPKKDAEAPRPASPLLEDAASATPAPSPAASDLQDPPWFLSASALSGVDNAAQAPSVHAKAGPAALQNNFEISRPETLRPSLPPLFGPDSGMSPSKPHFREVVAEAKRDRPSEPRQPVDPAPAAKTDKPVEPPAPEATPAAKVDAAPGRVAFPVAPAAGPAAGVADAPPDTKPVEAGGVAEAASPGEAGTEQARALEDMVAKLLEPVIRRWLDANLPRMVETVVREEVVRVIDAERSRSKS